jgi:hypothetical protein
MPTLESVLPVVPEQTYATESVLCVTPKVKDSTTKYVFYLHNPHLEFSMVDTKTLMDFVQELERTFSNGSTSATPESEDEVRQSVIVDIRFLYKKQFVLALSLPLSKVFPLAVEDDAITIVVNANSRYKVDYGNVYNKKGNDAFHEKKYNEAIDFYTISHDRYPNHLKPLTNRALCHSNNGHPDKCLADVILFETKYKEQETQNKLTSHDMPLYSKAKLRKAKACFELAKQVESGKQTPSAINTLLSWDSMEDDDEKEKTVIRLYRLSMEEFATVTEEEFAKSTKTASEFDQAWKYIFDHDDIDANPLPACPLCRSANIASPPSDFFPLGLHIVPNPILEYHNQTSQERIYVCNSCQTKLTNLDTQFFEKVYKPLLVRSEKEQREKSFVAKDVKSFLAKFMASLAIRPIFAKVPENANISVPPNAVLADEKAYASISKLRRVLIQKPNVTNKAVPPKQYMMVEDKDVVIKQKHEHQTFKWKLNQAHDKLSHNTVTFFHTQLGVFHFLTTIVASANTFAGAISSNDDDGSDLTNYQVLQTTEKVEVKPVRSLPYTLSEIIKNKH